MRAVVTSTGAIRLVGQAEDVEHAEETTDEHGPSVESGEDHSPATEAGEHATEGGHGGVEAPNPIIPATNELIWGGLSFAILFALMAWKLFPMVKKTMDARADRIREDLDAATQARSEAEGILAEYQRQLADAKNEANRIIEEARQTADQLRRDLMTRAEAEVADLRARNREEIEAAKARTMAELRSEVSGLAIDLAEKVVAQNLDRQTNTALVERFIAEVEGSRA
jgi:F-type H+-transporting ATPase subunit b